MENNEITQFLSNNSIFGAAGALILTILYKIYQILRKDKKEDDLDNAERLFRDELKEEMKRIKEENKTIRDENHQLHLELSELNAALKICRLTRPNECPLLNLHNHE